MNKFAMQLLNGMTTFKGVAILFGFTLFLANTNEIMVGICCYSLLIACIKHWIKEIKKGLR